jgi:Holliday junction resolvasome RuvABC endonuclease subunit
MEGNAELVFVGIDPSLTHTALVAMKYDGRDLVGLDFELIETEKTKQKQVRASSDTIKRSREIFRQSIDFIKRHGPAVVFAETPSGSQNASAMKGYGMSCFLIGTITPEPIEVTPMEVKLASAGSKTASKKEMIEWAMFKHPEIKWIMNGKKPQNKCEHIADAIAAIYAGMRTTQYRQIEKFLMNYHKFEN